AGRSCAGDHSHTGGEASEDLAEQLGIERRTHGGRYIAAAEGSLGRTDWRSAGQSERLPAPAVLIAAVSGTIAPDPNRANVAPAGAGSRLGSASTPGHLLRGRRTGRRAQETMVSVPYAPSAWSENS